ncbi:retrovirus-related pol polyprotein from transposon TNT 1-94 [Tanacetum coccineum]
MGLAKLSALTAENTKLKAQVSGKTSSGPSTSKTPKVLAPGMYNLDLNNGTEFVNKTLDGWFESVGISHETSVPRSPQQNGVVERRNRTLMEAARACYTLNRSLVHTLHGKTYYELLKGKKPNFNTSECLDLCAILPMTTMTLETVHVAFDELTEGLMSVQTSSGLAPQQMSSVPKTVETRTYDFIFRTQPFALVKDREPPSVPPTKKQVDDLFQWFDDDVVYSDTPATARTPTRLWCFFNEFLTHVEPKDFKQALEHSCWIEAMKKDPEHHRMVPTQKALYGLKQAPREWYDMLSAFPNQDIYLVLYNNQKACKLFAFELNSTFKIVDDGTNVILFRLQVSKSQRASLSPIIKYAHES